MQIHVVQEGDSVYSIARLYDSTPNDIIEANELETPDDLVIGQALVIPIVGRFYFVQPGDSLSTIAERFNMTAGRLAAVNGLNQDSTLPVGLRLYIPDQPPTPITSNAYIEPFGGTVSDTLRQSAERRAVNLTYLAPFSYEIQEDGTLKAPPLDNFKEIARKNDATLMMVVTNLADDGFSAELGRKILSDEALQDKLLDEIIQITKQVGFKDVHFDMEFLPPEMKESYNQFLRKAKQRLSKEGLLISTALAPKTSADQKGAWYEAHDYKAHGEIVDFVVLMTYEWGYSGGPPRAVSPIGPVTDVVNYALTEMPAQKILLGQNLYGYDWTLPYEPGGEFAKALSPQQAIQTAGKNNVAISYDEKEQAPYYTYTDADGKKHEVWFEDARSIQKKFDLIKEKNLLGISYWKLGLSFPQNWVLLSNQFSVTKNP
ncbi:LysM peptidoglycan-binding domain-containing protein [Halobacillus litoralis]|uniref:LysM peptidoglycan-binding domain-containing protein n=1 Tax=Halobacillus litoralis TaxID=45668 RepID=A0A845DTK5_9BACI|nr:glycoside hydrolase family 18 protein [Halobacillus litoralis]MCA1020449.1 glycoside hydrolase family 18 protein [Halobacillus litoralis]MYL20736.1 LysM peptidoglycan-binding domain-containing protein [Halobacillus litoralis]MYL29826.1 LysM peptidoglycan-binding domain-containing protein [Halobacillus halophilus]MYL39326.1 LysM peptidoglycan-binding domain-containing protein [Halobacillus litoralis]